MAENPEPLFIIDREAQISDHEVEEKLQLANNSEKVEKTMPFQNNEPDKTMPLDSTADLDDHLKKATILSSHTFCSLAVAISDHHHSSSVVINDVIPADFEERFQARFRKNSW